jgi:UDP-N-acetylglucosamine--N-acetylmuramyl-(pentapeptide) pyrophosphoryl-undecaprenol N-acetylglucosamine transferase
MGGSQGAQILNTTLPNVMKNLGSTYTIHHQVGKNNGHKVEQAYTDAQVESVVVTEFITDVAKAYAWADVIVCRSGALTVSEVSAAGVAAIFIPFMHKDRQQALNADYLVESGAAKMIEQPDLSDTSLTQLISSLDRQDLLTMANKARELAKLEADETVAKAIVALTEQ